MTSYSPSTTAPVRHSASTAGAASAMVGDRAATRVLSSLVGAGARGGAGPSSAVGAGPAGALSSMVGGGAARGGGGAAGTAAGGIDSSATVAAGAAAGAGTVKDCAQREQRTVLPARRAGADAVTPQAGQVMRREAGSAIKGRSSARPGTRRPWRSGGRGRPRPRGPRPSPARPAARVRARAAGPRDWTG